MTPIEKAKWLAEFYGAIAEGKAVQSRDGLDGWVDVPLDDYHKMPTMCHTLRGWRIKPEPRRMWRCTSPDKKRTYLVDDKNTADWYKSINYDVTEWLEVV